MTIKQMVEKQLIIGATSARLPDPDLSDCDIALSEDTREYGVIQVDIKDEETGGCIHITMHNCTMESIERVVNKFLGL